jgi:3-dehydroquinate synthase
MKKITQIILESKKVDNFWSNKNIKELGDSFIINYGVPETHNRAIVIKSYNLELKSIDEFNFDKDDLVIADENIQKDFSHFKCNVVNIKADENGIKTLSKIDKFINKISKPNRVVSIGGGITINISAYIAEQFKSSFVVFPTTPLAMSDASIGGKVRVNDIVNNKYIKHAHKSFYEPNAIFIDINFLKTLNKEQIKISLAEIIKHAVYQSKGLLEFLLSNDFDPYNNQDTLLKAILWTADLKRICLEIDPHDNFSKDGSNLVLRAAHDISDKIEEESDFKINHG